MRFGYGYWVLVFGCGLLHGYLVYEIWLWILGSCLGIRFMRFGYGNWVLVFGCGLLDMGMCLWV